MKKKHQKVFDRLFATSAMVLSLIAIIVSIRSCMISEESFEYTKRLNQELNTPDLICLVENDHTIFELENGRSVENFMIVLPRDFHNAMFIQVHHSFCLSKKQIILQCEIFFDQFNLDTIGVFVGLLDVPIVVDYTLNVLGEKQSKTELRNLKYKYRMSRDSVSIEFIGSGFLGYIDQCKVRNTESKSNDYKSMIAEYYQDLDIIHVDSLLRQKWSMRPRDYEAVLTITDSAAEESFIDLNRAILPNAGCSNLRN